MPRQRCCGLIEEAPDCRGFIPEGGHRGEAVVLGLEELEAIRLKDQCDMEQVDCAAAMAVSRATFQRILRSPRQKIDCGKRWEEPPCTEGGKHGYELACPSCGSMKKMRIEEDGSKQACGHNEAGHKHGSGCCGGGHHKHD